MKMHITLNRLANTLVSAVLLLVPFHAFLTVSLSGFVGHYTWLRLWDDVALALLSSICLVWLVRSAELRSWLGQSLLVRLILAYVALTLLLGVVSLLKGDVTPKALGYGLLVNLRYLIWFMAVLLTAQRTNWLRHAWPKLLLVPAAVVVLFAVLQYTVLPHNLLSHVGYSAETTIAPIETINHNPNYIRVMSTLRGANPLGAYLVIVLSALAALYMSGRRRVVALVFGVLATFALFASGSRSAWAGTILSLLTVVWFYLRNRKARLLFGSAALLGLAVLLGVFLLVRHEASVQNALLHTQDDSSIAISSNEAHASAVQNGLDDVWSQPFGDGPGTAGPASFYNQPHEPRIAENYYIQIAQETGWLGLALLLSIFALVTMELYRRVGRSLLALSMLASFIGIAFINLLSHAWVDDTLAFVWWGLAAVAIAKPLKPVKTRETDA